MAPATPLAPNRPWPLQHLPVRACKACVGGSHFIVQEPMLGHLDPQRKAYQVPLVGAPEDLRPAAPPRRGETAVGAGPGLQAEEEGASPFVLGCRGNSAPDTERVWGPLGAHLPLWDSAV